MLQQFPMSYPAFVYGFNLRLQYYQKACKIFVEARLVINMARGCAECSFKCMTDICIQQFHPFDLITQFYKILRICFI